MDRINSFKSNYERFGYLNVDFCNSDKMQNLKSEVDNLIEETFFIRPTCQRKIEFGGTRAYFY